MRYQPHYYKINPDFSVEVCECVESAFQSKDDNTLNLREIVNGHLVSTAFLPLDHNFDEDGEPHIFETMVFEGENVGMEIYLKRYSNYEEALKGHKQAIEWVINNG